MQIYKKLGFPRFEHIFAQNFRNFRNFYAKHNLFLSKLTKIENFSQVSAQNPTTDLWLCFSQLFTFSYKNFKIEGQKLIKQIRKWKLKIFVWWQPLIFQILASSSRMYIIEISLRYRQPESSNFYTASTLKCLNALAFGFTSQLKNYFFSRPKHIHFKNDTRMFLA